MLDALAEINGFQRVYLLALLVLTYPAWRGQRYALGCMWANAIAMLAVSWAMDLWLFGDTLEANKTEAYRAMMVVDAATGAFMVLRKDLPRVIAAGYSLTVPIYWLLFSGFFTRAEGAFTVIYIVSALQIVALGIGTLGGDSGVGGSDDIGGRRFRSVRRGMALSARGGPVLPGSISAHCGTASAHSGEGLENR